MLSSTRESVTIEQAGGARPGVGRAGRAVRELRRRPLLAAGLAILLAFALLAAFAERLTPLNPIAVRPALMLMPPGAGSPFGTDRFGRDIFTRVVYGTRVSLGIAVASIGLAAGAGTLSGLVAGFAGGHVDQVLSRINDVLLAFPSFLLALFLTAVMGSGGQTVVIAIGVVYTPLFFRVVRGSVLAQREQGYVEAATAFGAPAWWIMHRHILPNVLSPIIVQAAICLSYAILIESALSYLGVGVQPPTPSWGTILNEGRGLIELAPWISIFPGLFIMLSVLAFNFVSDGLRDILDPRVRRV